MEVSLNDEIVAVCTDLGHFNQLDGTYILNNNDYNTKTCIRDLIKYLRRDDNDFTVRRQMGMSNIVESDLIPIIEQHCSDDKELFDRVLRLLVDLTNPILLHFKEKMPKDTDKQMQFIQLENYLVDYKVAFASHKKVWLVIGKHMKKILDIDSQERDVEDELMFERILVLIRNILHIPIDDSLEKGTDDDKNAQDLIIENMHQSSINELLLKMFRSFGEYQYCFHLLEIVSLMMRDQNAEFLAKSSDENTRDNNKGRSLYEKEQDKRELKELRERDRIKQLQSKPMFTRIHGGTYYVKNMKSISDRDIIFHKTPTDLNKISFDGNKKPVRKPKNLAPMKDDNRNSSLYGTNAIHRSTHQIRSYLYEFCVTFLKESYNQFMHDVRDNLRKNHNLDNDETYYLWAMQFFMEFIRCNPKINDIDLVNETMSISSFHYLHTLIEHYLEMMKVQKDDWKQWSKRLHYGLKSYRELLFSLIFMNNLNDDRFKRHIEEIQKSIFYEVEYRDLLLHLICDYNQVKMSKAFLKDLIETNHVFLKMLENYCARNKQVVVRQKVKKRKKRSSKKSKKNTLNYDPPELIWSEISCEISDALQGNLELPSLLENNIKAFDTVSEKSSDQQKMDVMKQINKLLLSKKPLLAVALYREARNFWISDEDNAFGSIDILPEDELTALYEILNTDFPENKIEGNEEMNEQSENENENETEKYEYQEKNFSFQEAIDRYTHPNVVRTFSLLLQNYQSNGDQTNHCIIKMLHRIAWDCKMHAMLFQLSLFRTFQIILSDPLANSKLEEISKFAKFIIDKFAEVAKNNNKLFVELLFWKNCREAYEVEEGYGAPSKSKESKKRGKKKKGQDDNEDDLDNISNENKYSDEESNEKNKGQDESEEENINEVDPENQGSYLSESQLKQLEDELFSTNETTKRKNLSSDSESEYGNQENEALNIKKKVSSKKDRKSKKTRIEIASDSESENEQVNYNKNNPQKNIDQNDNNSEKEFDSEIQESVITDSQLKQLEDELFSFNTNNSMNESESENEIIEKNQIRNSIETLKEEEFDEKEALGPEVRKNKRKRIQIDSESESEQENHTENYENNTENPNKFVDGESDNESKGSLESYDNADDSPIKVHKKSRLIIDDSDSE